MGYYEIRKSAKDSLQPGYFVLIANNYEIFATSEMYSSKQAAVKGINSVCTNSVSQDVRDKT